MQNQILRHSVISSFNTLVFRWQSIKCIFSSSKRLEYTSLAVLMKYEVELWHPFYFMIKFNSCLSNNCENEKRSVMNLIAVKMTFFALKPILNSPIQNIFSTQVSTGWVQIVHRKQFRRIEFYAKRNRVSVCNELSSKCEARQNNEKIWL